MKTHSMNDEVYYQVTNSGRKVMIDNLDELYDRVRETTPFWRPKLQEPWRTDYDGNGSTINWYRAQLYHLFNEFGGGSFVGGELPIFNITFDEPQELIVGGE